MNIYRAEDYFREGEKVYVSPIGKMPDEVHVHDEFLELVYIYRGHGVHSIDNQPVEVSEGDLIMIALGQSHAILSDGMEYINCLLKPEFLSEVLADAKNSEILFSLSLFDSFAPDFDHQRCVAHFSGEEREEVKNLFRYIRREVSLHHRGDQFVLSGYMRIILSKMLRAFGRSSQAFQPSDQLNREILQYVNENCFGQLSLKQLAERYFYNPNYFSTKFREFSGKSLSAYITERRMEEAARLLRETDQSVETIYGAVGYQEKGHFYAAFKKYIGMTPKQYRMNMEK